MYTKLLVAGLVVAIVLVAIIINWSYSATREQKRVGWLGSLAGAVIMLAILGGFVFGSIRMIHIIARLHAMATVEPQQEYQKE